MQGLLDHRVGRLLPGPVRIAEQEYQVVRGREPGRIPKPAVLPIKYTEEGLVRLIEDRLRELALLGRESGRALQRTEHPIAGILKFLPLILPNLADPGDKVEETGHAVAALSGYITRCKEWFSIRGHEDGERPSPGPGQHMGGRHVDLVDIRPLFAVHLDADEDIV